MRFKSLNMEAFMRDVREAAFLGEMSECGADNVENDLSALCRFWRNNPAAETAIEYAYKAGRDAYEQLENK